MSASSTAPLLAGEEPAHVNPRRSSWVQYFGRRSTWADYPGAEDQPELRRIASDREVCPCSWPQLICSSFLSLTTVAAIGIGGILLYVGYRMWTGGAHLPAATYHDPYSGYDGGMAMAMTYFSAAAYSSMPQQCFQRAPKIPWWGELASYKVISSVVLECNQGMIGDTAECGAFAACSQDRHGNCEHIVLAYRGTEHPNQLLAEVGFAFVMEDFMGGKVGKYYLDVFHLLNESFNAALTEKRRCVHCRVTVTGHSLGGGIATIAAAELATQLGSGAAVSLYTFGEPRVGSCAFAHALDELVPRSYRVVHAVDFAPHVPSCKHTYPCECLSDPADTHFFHHGIEVWYNQTWDDRPALCPSDEDSSCSDSNFQHQWSLVQNSVQGVWDHLHYFGVFVGAFCMPSEHLQPVEHF